MTIIDVAKKAGVSKSTVSRVLRDGGDVSPEARARVQRVVQKLGYQPSILAGGLRSRRSYSLGLIIPDIANPFFPEIARGVQKIADERGYTVLLANSDWLEQRERKFLDLARRYHLDGLLINPAHISPHELQRLGCPVVVIGSRDAYEAFDCVGSDTSSAMRQAVEHLVELGHRRIALVPGPKDNAATDKRLAAFHEHTIAFGLQSNARTILYAEFTQDGGRRAAQQFMQRSPRPTAVICGNDLIALGMLSPLRAAGLRVPEEVSIVGIDNIDATSVANPPLTTIAKNKPRLGEEAAALLIDRIEGRATGPARHVLLPTELVSRESVAPTRELVASG